MDNNNAKMVNSSPQNQRFSWDDGNNIIFEGRHRSGKIAGPITPMRPRRGDGAPRCIGGVITLLILAMVALTASQTPNLDHIYPRCKEPYFTLFCYNEGRCYVIGSFAVCHCAVGYFGDRCDKEYEAEPDTTTSTTTSTTTPSNVVIVVIVIILLLLGLVGAVIFHYYRAVKRFASNLTP